MTTTMILTFCTIYDAIILYSLTLHGAFVRRNIKHSGYMRQSEIEYFFYFFLFNIHLTVDVVAMSAKELFKRPRRHV